MKMILKQMREMLVAAVIVGGVGTILLSILTYVYTHNSFLTYPIEGWLYACEIMDFFYPLLITIPFVGILYMKRKNRFIDYVAVRTDKKKYIKGQIKAGTFLSFVVTYIIYIIPLFLSVYWIYYTKDNYANDTYLAKELFGQMLVNKPIIFGLIWCVWKGLLASLLTRFGYYVALYVDNIFVISFAPFLYVFAENFVTANLGMPEISFITAFSVNRLDGMTPLTYVYGVITFLVMTTIITIVLKIRKEKQYKNV